MTATDELRRLLDERGVFWIDIPRGDVRRTCWKSSDEQEGYCYFDEDRFGVTNLMVSQLTSEQAIAATLGPGTCHDTWDTDLTGRLRFQCSECGAVSLEIVPRFCPNCGRKVVDA